MSAKRMHAVMAILTAASVAASPIYAQSEAPPAQPAQSQVASAPAPRAPASDESRKLSLGPDYSIGPHWFPNLVAPYRPRAVAKPILTNTPRINQLIQEGKLILSLEDAISLALENNLDIDVERYTPWLDQANLLLAKSGANGRLAFDPTLTGTFSLSQTTTPVNNPFFAGTGVSSATGAPTKTPAPSVFGHTFTANTQYTQGFATGTQAQVTFDTSRSTSSIPINLFNPAVQSTMTIELTQPLLNGFGKIPNTRYILEAKNTVKVGQSQFAQQVMTTVAAVANDYWELVYARENVKVEQAAVAVSQKLYDDNKKQLEIGTMAPLDVLTAESQLATDQQNLIVAQTTQLQDQTVLLNAITKDPLAGPLADIEIVPTTPISAPEIMESISLRDAVKEAWQKRPEIQQAELNLNNAGIEMKATKNALLPQLNLYGEYQATGLGGIEKKSAVTGVFAPDLAAPIVNAAGTPIPNEFEPFALSSPFIFPGGFGDDLYRMITARYPTFVGGLNLTLPIRNRSAQAANATAQLNQREQEASYRRLQNTIFVSVRNAQIALVQGRGQVAAAEKARTLAQQTLDDETKKYQLGSSTSYNVVLRSRDLTTAEGTELRARINLIEAAISFNQAVGRTLEVNNISLADAFKGSISHEPNIPGSLDADAKAGHSVQ